MSVFGEYVGVVSNRAVTLGNKRLSAHAGMMSLSGEKAAGALSRPDKEWNMKANDSRERKSFDSTDSTGTAFQTAAEYFSGGDLTRERSARTPRAKTIIWVDQATPLFVCAAHQDDVASLRWTGEESVADYDERRREAYRRLFCDGGCPCDVCAGDLDEKVGR